jgi:hypothetical protein
MMVVVRVWGMESRKATMELVLHIFWFIYIFKENLFPKAAP